MTLPLRGVTALSLSLYLKHLEMTVELLTALRKTRQIGKYTKYFETKTSCHPMGPIISFIDGRSLSRHKQRVLHSSVALLKLFSNKLLIIFSGRAIDQSSVDNASRREPPIITASRMGLLEAAALLVTHGASMEARDGQGRTALWHAVREEEDQIVEMLIHAGAKVFYENEDLACPTQLACKTALLKVKA